MGATRTLKIGGNFLFWKCPDNQADFQKCLISGQEPEIRLHWPPWPLAKFDDKNTFFSLSTLVFIGTRDFQKDISSNPKKIVKGLKNVHRLGKFGRLCLQQIYKLIARNYKKSVFLTCFLTVKYTTHTVDTFL